MGASRYLLRLATIAAATVVFATIAVPTAVWLVGTIRLNAAEADFTDRLGPLEPVAYRLPEVPEKQNAALMFDHASEQLRLAADPSDMLVAARAAVTPQARWDTTTRDVVERLVGDNSAVLEMVLEAAELEQSNYNIEYGLGLALPTRRVTPLVACGRLIASAARLEIGSKRTQRGLELLHALGRLASSLEQEVELGYQMGGWTCECLQQRIIGELAADADIDPRSAAAAARSLPENDVIQGFSRYIAWQAAAQIHNMKHPLGRQPGWWDRTSWRISRGMILAAVFNERLQLFDRLSAPTSELSTDLEHALPGARARAVDAGRGVVSLAAAIRATGDLSGAGDDDRTSKFTGTAVVAALQEDGSILVSLPGGDNLLGLFYSSAINPGPPMHLVLPGPHSPQQGMAD